jgi:pepF/M3 family oligoendopeptidase
MSELKTKAARWNLENLKDKDALQTYISGMDALDAVIDAAKTLKAGNGAGFDFPLWLSRYFELANHTGALEESLNAVAYAQYSTDTTNADYLNQLSKLEELKLRSNRQDVDFTRILTAHSGELENFYVRFPQYEQYRYVIAEQIIESYHLMTDAEENLADELERTGGGAWERLHEQIISNTVDTASGKTFNEIRNDAYNADREVRKTAWETEKALLKNAEIPIAACLNNIKGATVALNKRRSWNDAVERSLHSARVSRKTLDALIGAIEDSLPMWREYLKTKQRLLSGGSAETGLAFYDLFAPLTAVTGTAWTFDAAKAYIIEKFTAFSADMGKFADKAFAENWIDAETRKGKVGGAYCVDFPAYKQSRVLTNFGGSFSDVTTLAHELGHAYHHHCITDLDYSLQHYPMTLAETASIFAETIVMQDIISKSTGFDKARLIEQHLQDSCQVLVDILCRFYFERAVFEEREKGELAAADFCRLMADAQEKTYGAGLSDERHEYMWAVKSHYYSPHLDFYNFPYAFGLLFGTALYNRYRSEGRNFPVVYVKLLSQTGSLSCEQVCRNAGFDIETKEFWASGIREFENELQELH